MRNGVLGLAAALAVGAPALARLLAAGQTRGMAYALIEDGLVSSRAPRPCRR